MPKPERPLPKEPLPEERLLPNELFPPNDRLPPNERVPPKVLPELPKARFPPAAPPLNDVRAAWLYTVRLTTRIGVKLERFAE